MRGVRRHVRNFDREKDAGYFGAVWAPWAFCYREVAGFNTWRNKRVSAAVRPRRQGLKPAFHVHAFAARLKPGPDTERQQKLQKKASDWFSGLSPAAFARTKTRRSRSAATEAGP
jgi:hypothetical protein